MINLDELTEDTGTEGLLPQPNFPGKPRWPELPEEEPYNIGEEYLAEERAQENDRLRKLYLDEAEFAKLSSDPRIREGSKVSLVGEELPKLALNAAFLSHRLGRDIGANEYQFERDRYAASFFGQEKVNDGQFFDLVKNEFDVQRQKIEAIDDLRLRIAGQTLEDAVSGKDTPAGQVWTAWRDQYKDIVGGEDDLPFLAGAVADRNQFRAIANKYKDLAGPGLDLLRKFTSGEASQLDLSEFAGTLTSIPREEQDTVIDLIALGADAGQIDRGALKEFGLALGQTFSRGFNFIPQSVLQQKEIGVTTMVEAVENGTDVWVLPDGDLSKAVISPTNPDEGYEEIFRSDWRKATAEERQKMLDQGKESLAAFRLERQLRAVADNNVDPIKRFFDKGTLAGTIEGGVLGVAGSLPLLTATAVNPYAGMMAYQSLEYDRMKNENPDMNTRAAYGIAMIEGAWQAAIDRLQIKTLQGALPVTGRLLGQIKSTGLRRTLGFAASGAEQFGQELVQDIGTMGIDAIASALREDMQDKDFAFELGEYWKDAPEVLVSSLIFGMWGGGAITARELRGTPAEWDEAARVAGISEQGRARMRAATTPEELDAVVERELKAVTPESQAAGALYAKQKMQAAKAAQADPNEPTLEIVNNAEGNPVYRITTPDGQTLVETSDPQAAQAAFLDYRTASETNEVQALKDVISYWQNRDPELSIEEAPAVLVKEELDRLEGIGDAAGIERLRQRLAAADIDPDGDLTGVQIFGSTTVQEVGENVYRGTILVRQGAAPETVLEEVNHAFVRRALLRGDVNLDTLSGWLDQTATATGLDIKRGNEVEIIESIAQVGMDLFNGRLDQAQLPQSLVDYLRRLMRVVKEIYARAIKVTEAFDRGEIDGNFEQFLMQSMGMDPQQQIDINSQATAGALVDGPLEQPDLDLEIERGRPPAIEVLRSRLSQLEAESNALIDKEYESGLTPEEDARLGVVDRQYRVLKDALAKRELEELNRLLPPRASQPAALPEPAVPAVPKPKSLASGKRLAASPGAVEDFGQKLGGARKDVAPSLSQNIQDADLEQMPLSKIWPKQEVDAIEDADLAAMVHTLREAIPPKPRTGWRVKRWVEQVKIVRALARLAVDGNYDTVMQKMRDGTDLLRNLASKLEVLRQIPRKDWRRIGAVENYPDARRLSEGGEWTPSPFAHAEIDGKRVRAENLEELAAKLNESVGAPAAAKKLAFEVRGREGRGYFINKKGDPLYRKLKTFETAKEALAFARSGENYDELAKAWEEVKQSDNVKETDVRGAENQPRVGKDWRNGQDVTPEMFSEAFGFRGVEFGNWVSQGKASAERQWMLNQAYDALHDLADVLGLPTQALSLNGTLGLGFGSRGKGGFAAAHYEPDTIVINLTKTKGAGALAHEWFHALDHYFQRRRNATGIVGRSGDYITNSPETYYEDSRGFRLPESRYLGLESRKAIRGGDWKRVEGVRTEVAAAFAELVKVLDASPMTKRVKLIDKGKSGGYWSRIIERAARSFENYVMAKLALDGGKNEYLANVVSAETFARDKGRYPYLLPGEAAPISEAFDALFSTIQTRKTETGYEMYSLGRPRATFANQLEELQAGESNPVDTSKTFWLIASSSGDIVDILDNEQDAETYFRTTASTGEWLWEYKDGLRTEVPLLKRGVAERRAEGYIDTVKQEQAAATSSVYPGADTSPETATSAGEIPSYTPDGQLWTGQEESVVYHDGRLFDPQGTDPGGYGETQTLKPRRPDQTYLFSVGRSRVDRALASAMNRKPGERLAMYERAKEMFDRVAARRGEATGPDGYARTLQSLWELDAILKVLPAEVRGKVGGFTRIAELEPVDLYRGDELVTESNSPAGARIAAWMREGLDIGQAGKKTGLPEGYSIRRNTDPARATKATDDFLVKRLATVGKQLDRYLANEYRIAIERTLEAAKPKRSESGVRKSNLGPQAQAFADKVREAALLDNDQTAQRLVAIEAELVKPETADARRVELVEEWGILNTFGDLDGRNAETLAQGLAELREALKAGRMAWRTKEEERIAGQRMMIQSIINGLGEATKSKRFADKGKIEKLAEMLTVAGLDHGNFEQFLKAILPDEAIVTRWSDLMRKADIGAQDMELAMRQELVDAIKVAAKAAGMGKNAAMTMLKRPSQLKVRAIEGRKVTDERISIELAQKIVRGKADRSKLSNADVATLREALADLPVDTRKKFVTIQRVISAGNPVAIAMSPAQAIQLELSWDQPDVQEKMRREGWTDESIEDIRSITSEPVAAATLSFLRDFYARNYAMVNPVYARMFGMNMPQAKFYAPSRFLSAGKQNEVGLDGTPQMTGSTPGFAKARVSHSSPVDPVDALTVYQQHVVQTAHWVNFSEFAREARAVTSNLDLRESISQKYGELVLQSIDRWVEQLEQRGANKSREMRWMGDLMGAYLGGTAISSLGFNLRTVAINSDSAMRFTLVLTPRQIGRVLMSPVELAKALPKAWWSPTVQRRLKGGMDPATQFMFARRSSTPGPLSSLAWLSMQPVQIYDAAGTSLSSAMVYLANYQDAKDAGMPDAQAEQVALDAMDAAVYRYSQPTGLGSKSNIENNAGPFGKLLTLFMSDPRLKTGVMLEAVREIGRGKNVAMNLQRIMAIEAMALVSHVIASAYRDAFSDEEDEDIWSVEGFALAMLLAPFQGLFLAGAMTETALRAAMGMKMWAPPTAPFAGNLEQGVRAVKNYDQLFAPENITDGLKAWNNLLRGLSVSTPMGAPAALLNILKPFVGLEQNLEADE